MPTQKTAMNAAAPSRTSVLSSSVSLWNPSFVPWSTPYIIRPNRNASYTVDAVLREGRLVSAWLLYGDHALA